MVDFLLDNTLGAWHAGKVLAAKPTLADTAKSEEELRTVAALPGCVWKYLRFVKAADGSWAPAAGTFDGWPKTAKELRCIDPCMGSGHFVVAMFERLVALRMANEGLSESDAVAVVIRDNLFGLEIDSRCTQIAAFNLALAAWRRVGHCKLPAMNLAYSGLAPNAKQEEWLKLAGDNEKLQNGMERLYRLFKDAPVLGSLINPRASEGDLLEAAFRELQPLLEKALAQESQDDAAHEMAVTAHGLAKAAEILAGQFTLVATNVPYLKNGKQEGTLQSYCAINYPKSKSNLAGVFVERCLSFCATSATFAGVVINEMLFLVGYRRLRKDLLANYRWSFVAKLGAGAFETITGEVVNVSLVAATRLRPISSSAFFAIDSGDQTQPELKAYTLRNTDPIISRQQTQLQNPDARITISESDNIALLSVFSDFGKGSVTGDGNHYLRVFWELSAIVPGYETWLNSPDARDPWSGREHIVMWHLVGHDLQGEIGHMIRGDRMWGQRGVAVSKMSGMDACLYSGELFDDNIGVLLPRAKSNLPAIFAFAASTDYRAAIRKIDQALKVTAATLVKIPFDLAHWQRVAADKYPHGLPKPFSSDPTQWLFNGHPKGSDQPLHVAVARVLGYQWPRQTGSSFPDCPALGPDGLEELADADGIVCLSATKGEAPGAERLRGFLVHALGKFDLGALLASAGPKGSKSQTLDEWLRDEFFEQHCTLFHHRPFVWHIWDGHKSGFSALVNYHKLTHANLEKLAYAYLGDWIRRQQVEVEAEEAGSDASLQAAKELQSGLKLILEGEPPYDLFVRWTPLSKQAIGWHPDLNDGVRLNIRPFATAGILRKRVKIKWEKDRGKSPVRDKKEFPWFWGWDEEKQDFAGVGKEPDGNRWNDCHYTNETKKKAREANTAR